MRYFKYKDYCGSAEVDLDSFYLFGRILGIHDIVLYHAETLPELKRAFIEGVDQYLEDCAILGREPNKVNPYKFKRDVIRHCGGIRLKGGGV